MTAMIKAIYRNKNYVPEDPDGDFSGQTIIVTGSNSGLGLEASAKFAKGNCRRLILAVRNPEKGAAAQRIIQHLASDSQCKVEVWTLDMADYDSIKAFASRVDSELDTVDIALLNAGVFMGEYTKSVYGWEQTLQVNVLGTAYLALLLLPKLSASHTESHTPVLEFTGSGRAYAVTLTDDEKAEATNTLSEFSAPGSFNSGKLYRSSKLFLLYAAREIAALARPDPASPPRVLVPIVCPGACQSELSRDMTGMLISVARYYANMLFLRTAEEGARTLVSGTLVGERAHGEVWQNDVVKEPAAAVLGEEGARVQRKIWREVLDALEKDVPGARGLAKSL